jgi:hypothetical protein
MALTARFTTPLQVVAEPELKRRVQVIADREGLSLAQVYRDILWSGIAKREADSLRRVPADI